MKNKTLHMIGNAHLDPVWLWQWQEGFHEVKATFRSALDRMKEYDDFIFVSSSAAYYEWVEQNEPEMFAEIRQRVAEGRWQLVGGWWIQPDCNLPAGESFVRQALYGQRYFLEKFGVTAKVGYNVDSFGHNAMLPQLLKKAGLDYYIFMRPQPHEKGLPGRYFWWESDDGSRVLAFRIPFEYCTWGKGLESHVMRVAAELRPPFDETMCFYGVGNHGGGPTQENIESIRRMESDPDFPHLVFSTPERLFESLLRTNHKNIPVVHDELQHHASGCYTAHSGIKRWNRRAENALLGAEKWSAVARFVTGQPYPADFGRAWKNVLFNQFHDILAGTSLEEAYEDARDLYGESMAIAGRAFNNAVQSIAWRVRTPPEEGTLPVVVFNANAWDSRSPVELEFGRLKEGSGLVDDLGRHVPLQTIQSHAASAGRSRLCFVADLPALGYRTYRIVPDAPAVETPALPAGDDFMESENLRVEFDRETGAIARLFDKRRQVEVFSGPAALPLVIDDPSDTWSHNVFQYDQVEGTFKAARLRLVENGPVKATIRVVSLYGSSRLVQEFSLYRQIDRLDVRVVLDWREHHKLLKLRFPANLSHMNATSQIPYGHIERFASGKEEVGQVWLDLSGMARQDGQPYGVALLNDGKYSYDVRVRDIGLTVTRSPIYAHHIPVEPDPEGEYTYIDEGLQRFSYAILPHEGSWEQAGVVRQAAELNQPPFALIGTYHPEGTLPLSNSFASTDQPNVVISALKQAEDGLDVILRAVESHQESTRATLCLPFMGRVFEADFGPCEIKTFRIPADPSQPVVETDFLER